MNLLEKIRSFLFGEGERETDMKKFLIVGLGNVGGKYEGTRHNIGFTILDALARDRDAVFETGKLGDLTRFNHKGRTFILLKPSTYMNLSGKAVNYWLKIEKIPLENLLVVTDDLNLPFGTITDQRKGQQWRTQWSDQHQRGSRNPKLCPVSLWNRK